METERARPPAAAGSSPAVHTAPAADADDTAAALHAEALDLVAAVRAHLGWLRAGGVDAVPRPSRERARPSGPARAPAPAEAVHAHEAPGTWSPGDYATAALAALGDPAPARPAPAEPPRPRPAPEPAEPWDRPGEPVWSRDDEPVWDRAEPARPARPAAPAGPAQAPPPSPRPLPRGDVFYPELAARSETRGPGALHEIRGIIGDCKRCKLCHGRTKLVYDNEGAANAWLAFVGEGPGAEEDARGLPFVGAAGELLTEMLRGMSDFARKRGFAEVADHLNRRDAYICNVVKCRPPGNRTPDPEEIAACAPFLHAQLDALRPHLRVIVALGRTPSQYLLGSAAAVSKLRGTFADWNGIPVMPTYHPAYLLRTPSAKRQVWEDLKLVVERLAQPPA